MTIADTLVKLDLRWSTGVLLALVWSSGACTPTYTPGDSDAGSSESGGAEGDDGDSGPTRDDERGDDGGDDGGDGGHTVEPTQDDDVEARRPFPQAIDLAGIKPERVSQADMDAAVRRFYRRWRTEYIRASNGTTPGGGFVIEMVGTGDGAESSITTSEAHGYGMMIFALMAGEEPKAKGFFDGFYNMFDHHRSVTNPANMSWIIAKSEHSSGDSSSATDGDLDIAYALLLADAQWGSAGTIDYRDAAVDMINYGIRDGDLKPTNHWLRLGDWANDAWSDRKWATRSSDWMLDHLRSFEQATGDRRWNQAIDAVYAITDSIQRNHSPKTGLMPDFVLDTNPPTPAEKGYLDEPFVDFSENASRFPLRFAIDYGLHGDPRTKGVLTPVVEWVIAETEGQPGSFKGRYHLDGRPQESAEWSQGRMAYVGSMVAAASIDERYRDFLEDGWALMAERDPTGSYFDDTLQLLAMLYVSGNWWAP